jgi:predicted nucleic acid-binding protein
MHGRAVHLVTQECRELVLSDYVVDEACALFLARRVPHQRRRLFQLLEKSRMVKLIFMEETRFRAAKEWMLRLEEHPLSLTDCASFVVMRELNLQEVMTTDRHFSIAGFTALLT